MFMGIDPAGYLGHEILCQYSFEVNTALVILFDQHAIKEAFSIVIYYETNIKCLHFKI